MNWLDIEYVVWEVWGYEMSLLELLGTITGLITVVYASRSHILTWPTGLVNVALFFVLFYQVQLYSDMLLQVYFFATGVYGWIYWQHKKGKAPVPITTLSNRMYLLMLALILVGSIGLGIFMSGIHETLPAWFPAPAAYPFADALTTVLSVLANLLLARRILETWLLWIAVDLISIVLYLEKGILLMSVEYGIFLIIASYGLYTWMNLYQWKSD